MLVKLTDSEKPFPLGSAGDGLKRLLALSISLIASRGGYLLVDEIDTGLHFSVMEDMWRLVIQTAQNLDIQVFATTHSLDCLKSLAWLVESKGVQEDLPLRTYRVESEREEAVAYSPRELVAATERHIEVR